MVSAVTLSTLESNAYDNVLSYLNNRAIIVDPRDKDGFSKRPFVYDADPLVKGVNFADFPYIVAEFPTVEYSAVSADGKSKNVSWTMNLTVRTARDGASQGTSGVGKVDMLAICDDLHGLFNSVSYKHAFALLNMHFMELEKTNSTTTTIDDKYVYEASFELSFTERLEVSS